MGFVNDNRNIEYYILPALSFKVIYRKVMINSYITIFRRNPVASHTVSSSVLTNLFYFIYSFDSF